MEDKVQIACVEVHKKYTKVGNLWQPHGWLWLYNVWICIHVQFIPCGKVKSTHVSYFAWQSVINIGFLCLPPNQLPLPLLLTITWYEKSQPNANISAIICNYASPCPLSNHLPMPTPYQLQSWITCVLYRIHPTNITHNMKLHIIPCPTVLKAWHVCCYPHPN